MLPRHLTSGAKASYLTRLCSSVGSNTVISNGENYLTRGKGLGALFALNGILKNLEFSIYVKD